MGQVGEGVHQAGGQRRRRAHLESAGCGAALGRHREIDPAGTLLGSNHATERIGLEHAVDVDREAHLHGVGFFIRQRQHPDHGFAFAQHLDPPVGAGLGPGTDGHPLLQ